MTTVSILPVLAEEGGTFIVLSGDRPQPGKTPGQALDAILDQDESATLVVVQRNRPDRFFAAEQPKHLEELMTRWRAAPVPVRRWRRTNKRNSKDWSRRNCVRPVPDERRPWQTSWNNERLKMNSSTQRTARLQWIRLGLFP